MKRGMRLKKEGWKKKGGLRGGDRKGTRKRRLEEREEGRERMKKVNQKQ